MSTEQECVVSTDAADFERRCNRLLLAGWKVIPETIFCSGAATNETRLGITSAIVVRSFVAFFERK